MELYDGRNGRERYRWLMGGKGLDYTHDAVRGCWGMHGSSAIKGRGAFVMSACLHAGVLHGCSIQQRRWWQIGPHGSFTFDFHFVDFWNCGFLTPIYKQGKSNPDTLWF